MKIEFEMLTEEEVLKGVGIASSDRLDEAVQTIREWMKKQPHLPQLPQDDATTRWLQCLIVCRKNRLEMVKENVDMFFASRTALPELFAERDPTHPSLRSSCDNLYLFSLPKLSPDGYRIHFFRHANGDSGLFDPLAFMRRTLMIADISLKEDTYHGDLLLFDMTNGSLAHWARYNLQLLSKFVLIVTKIYPLRVKAIHFINAPAFVNHIIKIMKPFLSDKIFKRIKVHTGDIENLLEDIPKSCLPKEIGGTLDITLDQLNNHFQEKIEKEKEWFIDNEQYKSDEGKRIAVKQSVDDLFGIEGTFRTLAVD